MSNTAFLNEITNSQRAVLKNEEQKHVALTATMMLEIHKILIQLGVHIKSEDAEDDDTGKINKIINLLRDNKEIKEGDFIIDTFEYKDISDNFLGDLM